MKSFETFQLMLFFFPRRNYLQVQRNIGGGNHGKWQFLVLGYNKLNKQWTVCRMQILFKCHKHVLLKKRVRLQL